MIVCWSKCRRCLTCDAKFVESLTCHMSLAFSHIALDVLVVRPLIRNLDIYSKQNLATITLVQKTIARACYLKDALQPMRIRASSQRIWLGVKLLDRQTKPSTRIATNHDRVDVIFRGAWHPSTCCQPSASITWWEACFDSLTYILLVAWFACHYDASSLSFSCGLAHQCLCLECFDQVCAGICSWPCFARSVISHTTMPCQAPNVSSNSSNKSTMYFAYSWCSHWCRFDLTSLYCPDLRFDAAWELLTTPTLISAHLPDVSCLRCGRTIGFWGFILVTPRLALFLFSPDLTKLRNALKRSCWVCVFEFGLNLCKFLWGIFSQKRSKSFKTKCRTAGNQTWQMTANSCPPTLAPETWCGNGGWGWVLGWRGRLLKEAA